MVGINFAVWCLGMARNTDYIFSQYIYSELLAGDWCDIRVLHLRVNIVLLSENPSGHESACHPQRDGQVAPLSYL